MHIEVRFTAEGKLGVDDIVTLKREVARSIAGSEEPIVTSITEDRHEIAISLPCPRINRRVNTPLLFSLILGNAIRSSAVAYLSLQEIRLPQAILKSLGGPRYGQAGIREFLGLDEEPLMSVPLTTSPEQQFETMDQVEQLARAGVHLISDPPQRFYSSSDELAGYVEDFIDRMTGAGCRAIPFVNAQAPLSTLRKLVPRLARVAADRQWPIGLRLDPFLLGLAAVETLTRPGLVLFAYSQLGRVLSSGRSGVSPRVLAYLLRVLGVDIVAMGTGSVTFERPESIPAVVDELRRTALAPGIKPSCPLLTGGIGPRAAHSLAQQFGSQIALHAARSVFEGPLQLRDNVAAIRQAFVLGLAGKGYEEAVEHGGRQHKQLVDFERKIAATN